MPAAVARHPAVSSGVGPPGKGLGLQYTLPQSEQMRGGSNPRRDTLPPVITTGNVGSSGITSGERVTMQVGQAMNYADLSGGTFWNPGRKRTPTVKTTAGRQGNPQRWQTCVW